MKKIYLIIIIFVLGIVYFIFYNSAKPKSLSNEESKSAIIKDVKNNTYIINSQAVILINGREEINIPSHSASKQITQYFGNEVEADFNNDGFKDSAFLLTQNSGGSGTFFYVAVALGSKDGYVGTNAILLGDRIAPQTSEYQNEKIVINYADRKVTDSFAIAPSIGVSKYFKIDNNSLIEVLK